MKGFVIAQQPVAALHIGAMKTGTTYLQHKLFANRAALEEQGVDFAGDRWRDQVSAVVDLLSINQHDPAVARRSDGAWDRLVEAMAAAGAPVSLLSMEFLSFADAEQAAVVVRTLEAAGLEVRIVLTVRDTAAVIPALWQTSLTSGGIMTWDRFTKVVRTSTRGGGRVGNVLSRAGLPSARRFSEAIDIPRMLRVWTSVLPPEQVHVVLVPGSGAPRDLLWELFSAAVGIDPAASPAPPEHANESLGLPSAELVRRLNVELDLERPTEQRVVKFDLARDALSLRRHDERKARLDPATFRAAMRWNRRIRSDLERLGVVVHGSLDDLPDRADPSDYDVDADQREATDEELLAAARQGYQAMFRLNRQRSNVIRNPDRRKKYRRQLRRRLVKPDFWDDTDDPVTAALADLAVLCRSAVRLEKRALRKKRRQRARRRERRAARRAAQQAQQARQPQQPPGA